MNGEAMYINEAKSPIRQVKRVNFFQKWIWKYVKDAAMAEEKERTSMTLSKQPSVDRSIDQPDRAIHFTVYNANGGRVVETRRYDRKTDRSISGLYVITNDQEFGKEIDKIITMEALKQ